ncbi:MAG: class I SAM-dependent methyltransferase [Gemmatimonadota bacterium]
MQQETARAFRAAYAEQRASEGRGAGGEAELLALPYLETGPQAKNWQVRARTFDHFVTQVLQPLAITRARPLRIADLGAGNGWLCYRLARLGHDPVAIDPRTDAVDGLGAAASYKDHLFRMFRRISASFDALPLHDRSYDLVVFNAALHYAIDLGSVLTEAARVTDAGGSIAILDSPFYSRDRDGAAMVTEKRRAAARTFADRGSVLLAPPFIEYLTRERLQQASGPLGLHWRRCRVRYPLWYELRPLLAAGGSRRSPSRFDIWEARLP